MHHRTFGPYQIVRPLGAGSLGVTYLAQCAGVGGFERHSALRSFPSNWLRNPTFLPHILANIQKAREFAHPYLVDIEAFAIEEGEFYLATEFVDGVSLATLMAAGGRLPSDLVLLIAIQTLQALEYVHQFTGVVESEGPCVHGDLSPSHIILSSHGSVKITGFGLRPLRLFLRTYYPNNSPQRWRFLAPEQRDSGTPSVQSDLYAIGVIMYEALSGTTLGSASRSPDIMGLSFPPLREVFPEVSPHLEAIVHQALAEDPEARFSSALEFLDALESFVAPTSCHQLQRVARELVTTYQEKERAFWLDNDYTKARLVPCTAAARPVVYVLSQDQVFSPDLCQQLSDPWGLGAHYDFQFLSEKAHVDWAYEMLLQEEQIPSAVLFGGLHVALSHPFLALLQQYIGIARVLVLEHPNTEIFQISIDLCGLDAFLPAPVDLNLLSEVLYRICQRPDIRRRMAHLQVALSEVRQEESELFQQLQSLRETSDKAQQMLEELRHQNQALSEKNRFLQQVSKAVMQPPAQTEEDEQIFFQGRIEQMRLVDLCQLMGMSQKTAVISLRQDEEDGAVHFEDGALIHATCGPLKGRIAMSYLMRWEEGRFKVRTSEQAVERTIFQQTDQLLLDILREQDESAASSFEIALPEGDWL